MGLRKQRADSVTGSGQADCDKGQGQLGRMLGLLASQKPDLAEVVKACDSLPEPVRKGILAMVQAAGEPEKT